MAYHPSRSPALSLLPMLSCIGLAVALGASPLPARAAIEDCFTDVPVPPKPRPSVRKQPAPAAAPATRVLADSGEQAPGARASTGAAPATPVAKAPPKPATRAVTRTAAAPAGSAASSSAAGQPSRTVARAPARPGPGSGTSPARVDASSRTAGQPSRPVARAPARPGPGTAPAAASIRKLLNECMPAPVRELQAGPVAPADAPRANVVRRGPSLIEAAIPDAPLLVGILSGLRGDAAWVVAADTAEADPDTPAIAVVGPWGSTGPVVAWGGGSGGGGAMGDGAMGGGAYGPGPFGAGGPMSGFGGTGSPATRFKPASTGSGDAVQDLVVPLGTPGSLAGVGDDTGVPQAAVVGPFAATDSPGGTPPGNPDAGGGGPQPGLGDPPVSPPAWGTGDPPADTTGPTVTPALAAVPVPGSAWLLALGAGALPLFGKRRRQSAKHHS